MTGLKTVCGALCLSLSFAVAADAIDTLNDAGLFRKAQGDVAAAPRAELDALVQVVATCSAASIGQRMQLFECEKGINIYWAQYNRGRAIDNYLTAFSGLLVGFDNNPLNPTPQMTQTYIHATNDLVALTKSINTRYRQLDK